MQISSRLKTIGDFIKNGENIIDVGADHGLLELYLIAKYPNTRILAVENKIGPYKILENNLKGYKSITLSLSNGLESLTNEYKTAIIAGMGGINIRKILLDQKDKVKNLTKIVIDAHRDISLARKTIVELGFKINKEKIVYEQEKFYVVSEFIKAEKPSNYNEDIMQFGYQLYLDDLWSKYKEKLISQNKNKIAKIKKIESMQDKVLSLTRINERLENYGKN